MPRAARAKNDQGTSLSLEVKLWQAADALRNNMDAAEYKHVVLGLIFLKYISDAFEAKHAELVGDHAVGADPEDPDEYRAASIFWVPKEARWTELKAAAPQPTIGTLIDDAMTAIERDNPSLKGVLPKDFARPGLDKARLGQLINLVSDIALGAPADRAKDTLGRVYEYFLPSSRAPRASRAASSKRPRAWSACSSRCSPRTRAACTIPAAAAAACSSRASGSSRATPGASATSASTARSPTTRPGASRR